MALHANFRSIKFRRPLTDGDRLPMDMLSAAASATLLKVIAIDLVLAGDDAVVIGLAVADSRPHGGESSSASQRQRSCESYSRVSPSIFSRSSACYWRAACCCFGCAGKCGVSCVAGPRTRRAPVQRSTVTDVCRKSLYRRRSGSRASISGDISPARGNTSNQRCFLG